MAEHGDGRIVTDRRSVLAFAGTSIGASFGFGGLASFGSDEFVAEQDGNCYPMTPLSGDAPVEQLYDWGIEERDASSNGTTHLQRPDTSVLFLYDGPSGLSLVVVHGKYGEETDDGGGAVTFEFAGLPRDGRWVVQDDLYEGPTNYDNWSRSGSSATVDWTWANGRTDGGAFRGFRGLDDAGFELTIAPAFNEAADLYGEYYDGRVTEWHVLSGSLEDPDRHSLALDRAVTISRGTCGGLGGLLGGGETDSSGGAESEGPADEAGGDGESDDGGPPDGAGDEGNGRGPPTDEGGPPFDDDGRPGRGAGPEGGDATGEGVDVDVDLEGGDESSDQPEGDDAALLTLVFGG